MRFFAVTAIFLSSLLSGCALTGKITETRTAPDGTKTQTEVKAGVGNRVARTTDENGKPQITIEPSPLFIGMMENVIIHSGQYGMDLAARMFEKYLEKNGGAD